MLADLSQITCFFWFETIKVLETAEKIRTLPPSAAVPRLAENAIPSEYFKKWLHTIISTIQVSTNLILLALMFISRLQRVKSRY